MYVYMYKYFFLYRRANGIYIYPQKWQFAVYEQFVLVFFKDLIIYLIPIAIILIAKLLPTMPERNTNHEQ